MGALCGSDAGCRAARMAFCRKGVLATDNLRLQPCVPPCSSEQRFASSAALRSLPLAEGSGDPVRGADPHCHAFRPAAGQRPTRALDRWITGRRSSDPAASSWAVFHPAALLLLAAALCNASLQHAHTQASFHEDVHTTLFYSALVGTVALTAALPWGIDQVKFTLSDGGLPPAARVAGRPRPLVPDRRVLPRAGVARSPPSRTSKCSGP